MSMYAMLINEELVKYKTLDRIKKIVYIIYNYKNL